MNEQRKQLLMQLKQYWESENIPNVSEANWKFLNFLIKQWKYKNWTEIWTANWYSTIWLWDAFESNWWKLTSFEIQENTFDQAKDNVKKAGLESTVTIRQWDFLKKFWWLFWWNTKINNQWVTEAKWISYWLMKFLIKLFSNKLKVIDFVFIDWKKAEYLEYLNLVKQFLHKNAVVILDDVVKYKDKMPDFYQYIDNQSEFDYFILPLDDDKNAKDWIMILTKK